MSTCFAKLQGQHAGSELCMTGYIQAIYRIFVQWMRGRAKAPPHSMYGATAYDPHAILE